MVFKFFHPYLRKKVTDSSYVVDSKKQTYYIQNITFFCVYNIMTVPVRRSLDCFPNCALILSCATPTPLSFSLISTFIISRSHRLYLSIYRRIPRNKLNPLGKYGCLDSCDMVGLDFGSGCKHCFTISLTSSSGMAPNTSSPGL